MLIPKELILEAKEKLGEKAAEIIKDELDIQNWDSKSLKGSCPLGHSDSTPSFVFNPKSYSFHCFSCGRNFSIIDLYMHRGLTFLGAVEKLFNEVGIDHKFSERGVKTKRNYKYPIIECSEDRSLVEKYFEARKISKETLDYCNIGQDLSGNVVWKFFDENDNLVTVKLRHSHKPTEKEDKEWYLPNYDYTPILFNMNRVDPSNGPLVITEGQCDTLAVIESNYFNVVSVPGGSQNNKWIEECFDWLEEFKQIIIFSDGDEAGIKMRKEVVARLGQWRCKFVEIPEEYLKVSKELKDANAILFKYGKQAVLDLINNAQEIPIIGVTNLASVDDFEIDKAEGFITNIPSLDEMLYKIVFGNVMVITGRRGEGKSSFINQLLCEALDQGYDSFIFSGELSAPVLKSWLNVTMAGYEKVTMKNKFVHQINPDAKKKMEQWYDERLWFYDDQTSNGTDDILNKAIAVTRKYGAKLWILDNLLVMDINSKSTDVYEKQKDFMTKLIGLANLYNVLIILAIHPRKGQNGVEIAADDVGGSGALTNLPQYVLATKKFSEKEKQGTKDGRGNYKKGFEPIDQDVSISVLKNRFIGRTGDVRLYFDYKSRRFYCDPVHLNKRYKWNKDNAPLCKYNPLDEKTPDAMHT
jgi:twinkle protein